MKKFAAIFVMLLVIVACTSDQGVYREAKDAVVLVENPGVGIGTGFFIEKNVIVTNYHVIKDNTSLNVITNHSNEQWKAEVIASSEKHDIAIIKIVEWDKFAENNDWNVLHLINTNTAEVGDTIYTLGHPWGMGWSFSKGVLSAKERSTQSLPFVLFLQVDAKVYKGNSGGPLLDAYGNVLGVNSIMISKDNGSYGLAIEADFVKKVVYDLKKYKKSEPFKLGVLLKGENSEVIIQSVSKNSVAEKCGLEKDDVINFIKTDAVDNFVMISNIKELIKQILTLNMDQNRINLMITRNEEVKKISCEL